MELWDFIYHPACGTFEKHFFVKEGIVMTVSEKAKERLDEAGKEIKEAIDNLKQEVEGLAGKARERLKGAGDEMRESAEELTQDIKALSEKVRDLIPKIRKKGQAPVKVDQYHEYLPDFWRQPVHELRKATDRFFEDFFRGFRGPLSDWRSPLDLSAGIFEQDWPRVDIDETDVDIRISAELPGVDRDNIDISVTGNRITIRGEKKEQGEKKKKGYYKFERSYGSFQRMFSLPCEVETDKVDASFKDGILSVKLPKSNAAREIIKKIPVHSG
jgi:HSP20 family protein